MLHGDAVFQVATHTDNFHDIRHNHGSVCHYAVDVWLLGNGNDAAERLRQHTMHRRRQSLRSLCTAQYCLLVIL